MESTIEVAQLTIIDTLFIGVCLKDPAKAVKNILATREAIAPKRSLGARQEGAKPGSAQLLEG